MQAWSLSGGSEHLHALYLWGQKTLSLSFFPWFAVLWRLLGLPSFSKIQGEDDRRSNIPALLSVSLLITVGALALVSVWLFSVGVGFKV